MALTHTLLVQNVTGAKREVVDEITLDASYPTGGYAVTPANFGLTFIDAILPGADSGTPVPGWDKTNSKILLYVRTTGVEVANAVDLSPRKIRVLVIGN